MSLPLRAECSAYPALSALFEGDVGRVEMVVRVFHQSVRHDLRQMELAATAGYWALVHQLARRVASGCRHVGEDAVLATTTSSLPIGGLAEASGHPERFVGLHVFNPVPKMELVELAFPPQATAETKQRAHALCAALGKTAVEVPDIPGFVVNRLLFPFLFEAVRLMERTGLDAKAIDTCMQLGAGHPMGPLALLDLVGLDVSAAIGRTIDVEVPDKVNELIAAGALGRKAGHGFHAY